MRTGTFARATALSGAALLALTACGGSSDDSGGSGSSGGASSEKQVNVYGTDGNMGNALGEDFDENGRPGRDEGHHAADGAGERLHRPVEAGRPQPQGLQLRR